MLEVIATGKSVEEATENACKEIGLRREEVSVEILEMPVRKLFKSIPAKVKVTANKAEAEVVTEHKESVMAEVPKKEEKAAEPAASPRVEKEKKRILPQEPEEAINLDQNDRAKQAVEYLQNIFQALGLQNVELHAVKQGDATLLKVSGEEINSKMEVRGETIQALSYLIDRSVNAGVDKKDDAYLRIRLDIAGYRNRRETELIALADRTGKEVAKSGRSRTLAPMNPYERLIVHTAISNMEGITSESIGADVERRVVIKSLAENATDGDDWKPAKNQGRKNSSRSNETRSNDRGKKGKYQKPSHGKSRKESNTPQREYAAAERNPSAAPIIPEQREAIKDGNDIPLYGKIEI